MNIVNQSSPKKVPHNISIKTMPVKLKQRGRPRTYPKAQKSLIKNKLSEENLLKHKDALENLKDKQSASAPSTDLDEPIKKKKKKGQSQVPINNIRIDTSKEHLSEYGPQLQYAHKLW